MKWIQVWYADYTGARSPSAYIQVTSDMTGPAEPTVSNGWSGLQLTEKGASHVSSIIGQTFEPAYWNFSFITKRTIDKRMKEIPKVIPLQEVIQ